MKLNNIEGVSVLLYFKGNKSLLERFLLYFANNTFQTIEIIIVNSNLNVKIENIVSQYLKRFSIKQLKYNKSYASVFNYAASHASYPYLLFVNTEIIYSSDLLSLAIDQLADDYIGAVGVRIDDAPSSLLPGQIASVQHTGIKMGWSDEANFFKPCHLSLKKVEDADKIENSLYPAVRGDFLLCRREDFMAVGGFSVKYGDCFADVDFCLKLYFEFGKRALCLNKVSLQRDKNAIYYQDKKSDKLKEKKELDSIRLLKDDYDDKLAKEIAAKSRFSQNLCLNKSKDKYKLKTVSIVVCVHNALEDTKLCLESVIRNTTYPYQLYIINDGSNQETTAYLRNFIDKHQDLCTIIENEKALGYTKSANLGLMSSKGDYVILLNSDTIVPYSWLKPLLRCAESDEQIGIVGPLSNAASYQSVPRIKSDDGGWEINDLPVGYTVDQMADLVAKLSDCRYPRVPFINGFCYLIKRQVIEKIGYFDEESFPRGYGEENDYSIRAFDHGFSLVIVDDAYVYHTSSKSFTHTKRKELSKAGRKALIAKHGSKRRESGITLMEEKSTLIDDLRFRMMDHISNPNKLNETINILWLLLGFGGYGGGTHSIIQEAAAMKNLPGVHTEVALTDNLLDTILDNYRELPLKLFYFYSNEEKLIEYGKLFDVVIATYHKTFPVLKKIYQASGKRLLPAYYVQDYEPWFIPKDKVDRIVQAENSYTALPSTVLFAKSDWVCNLVKDKHGVNIHKVKPSLDTDLYHYKYRKRKSSKGIIHIAAMVRPSTPRRAPEETMQVLKSVKQKYGQRIRITIFGNDPNSKDFKKLTQDFDFNNLGVISRSDVAKLFSGVDIFIDMSYFQAFGLTAIEAMAMGCVVIVPEEGGVHEFARNMGNAVIIDTKNINEAIYALQQLVENVDLRNFLSQNAMQVTEQFNLRSAAWSQVELFRRKIN